MASTKVKPGQHSLKSFGLNVAASLLFATPFLIHFYGHLLMAILGANAATLAFVWLLPPRGWKRPHPYSDQEYLRRG